MMELSQLRCDIADLTRLAQIKADERECKARDYLKAEVRCHKITEELKIKELSVQDNAKKYSDVQRRYFKCNIKYLKSFIFLFSWFILI